MVSSRSVGGWTLKPIVHQRVIPQGFNDLLAPPGVGLEATLTESWSIEGANRGMAGSRSQAGQNHSQTSSGWSVFLVSEPTWVKTSWMRTGPMDSVRRTGMAIFVPFMERSPMPMGFVASEWSISRPHNRLASNTAGRQGKDF